jgi:hypothetical protein
LGPELDSVDAIELAASDLVAADIRRLEMVAADDRHGPVMGGEIAVVVAVVKAVVDKQSGAVVPSQGAPADVVAIPPPVHPGRTPVAPGDPVPAEAETPVPAAVMVDRPAPRLGRDPGPADDGVPGPTAVVIGPPIIIRRDVGDPDVAIRPFVDPLAVLVKLLFVIAHVGREVLPLAPFGQLDVAAAVPIVERVAAGKVIFRIAEKPAVGGGHGLLCLEEHGALLGRRFQTSFTDEDLGLPFGLDLEPVQAFLEDVERRIGGVDLDALIEGELAHPEIDAALRQVDLDALLPFRGQDGEFDLGVVVEAEIVPVPEMDLGLADLGPHLVSLDQGEVDLSLFESLVGGPLDVDRAVDKIQAGKAVRVESLVLGLEAEGDKNDEGDRQERSLCHHLVHRLSPSAPILSNYRARRPPPREKRPPS